jgi:hypothetical protein
MTQIKLIPGERADVRVMETALGHFKVQYLYSRKLNTWRTVQRRDGHWHDTSKTAAIARAKTVADRNN